MTVACERLELPAHTFPGTLITFCGVDGSGKSSILRRIAAACEDAGVKYLSTATPTARIREDALFRELVDDPLHTADWSPLRRERAVSVLGLMLSILGDLVQHTADTIVPALERGDVVLCDRYIHTSHAEIVARSSLAETQPILAAVAQRLPRPDVAFGLDVSMHTSHARVSARRDSEDRPAPAAFLARQVDAYREVIRVDGLTRLDTERDVETTASQALLEVMRVCSRRHGAWPGALRAPRPASPPA